MAKEKRCERKVPERNQTQKGTFLFLVTLVSGIINHYSYTTNSDSVEIQSVEQMFVIMCVLLCTRVLG